VLLVPKKGNPIRQGKKGRCIDQQRRRLALTPDGKLWDKKGERKDSAIWGFSEGWNPSLDKQKGGRSGILGNGGEKP